MTPPRRTAATVLLTLLLGGGSAAGQVPPDARYLTFDTDHFRVVFPDGLEPFARRAAASAEWAYEGLSRRFLSPPGGRISLIIADTRDAPNASATPIPTNRIVLIAAPDIASRQLNYYSDWLDLTLAHELTHIFHMDRAGGLWRIPRALFGRFPTFFPAFYQPRWVIEGLATYYESRLTGSGRAYGSYFESLVGSAARGGELRGIDAANGLSPTWPFGQAPYAYGGLYFRSLAEEHGDSAITAFARKGAARLPYTLDWAGSPIFGHTLSDGWREWRQRLRAAATEADPAGPAGEPLSDYSWTIPTPHYSPDGRYLAYTFLTPRGDPQTVIAAASSGRVIRRVRRNSTGGNSWGPESSILYTEQPEYADRYAIHTDLYALDVASGDQRRLTHAARLRQPDLAPDGERLVAVQVGAGTNRLIVYELASGVIRPLTAFRDTVNWNHPRFSPDGTLIAAERWLRGEILDIVLVDTTGRTVCSVTSDPALDVTPAWSPDGRHLLWSSDRSGVFDLYAAEIERPGALATDGRPPAVRRITRSANAIFDPEVAPDGRWLAYVSLHAAGFRIERIPFAPSRWTEAPSPAVGHRPVAAVPEARTARAGGEVRGYSPFPSLWPRAWLPVGSAGNSAIGAFLGATTFGSDDVGRHSFGVLAGWRTGVDDVEAEAVYIYRGLGDPTLQLNLSQDWGAFLAAGPDGETFLAVDRGREAAISATFRRPRIRNVLAVTPALEVERFHLFSRDPRFGFEDPTFTDLGASLAFGFSTARMFPRSLSPEDGFTIRLDLSHRRIAEELDRWRVGGELALAGYMSFDWFGYADHVLAGRLGLAASSGRQRSSELFDLGGVPGRALEIVPGIDLGAGAEYPVRGFDEGVQRAERVAAASLEYRIPLALVGRGHGLWPLLLDRLSASVFLDAGSAWRDAGRIRVLAGTGGELSLDLGVGYALVYRFRAGLARQLATPAGATADWKLYLAAGVAF